MTTFALVHAAWHGPWCWEHLTPHLRARGHDVVAPELPIEDPEADCSLYAETVHGAIRDVEDDVVVVGHSLGGLTIPLIAAARPVRRLVFLCALVPQPGRSLLEELKDEPETLASGFGRGLALDEAGRSYWRDLSLARETLYQDCPAERAKWAAGRLRPQGMAPHRERCPVRGLPEVESAYILCRQDRVVDAEWSRRAARERLGIEPLELDGGHSPFLSQPEALAEALVAL